MITTDIQQPLPLCCAPVLRTPPGHMRVTHIHRPQSLNSSLSLTPYSRACSGVVLKTTALGKSTSRSDFAIFRFIHIAVCIFTICIRGAIARNIHTSPDIAGAHLFRRTTNRPAHLLTCFRTNAHSLRTTRSCRTRYILARIRFLSSSGCSLSVQCVPKRKCNGIVSFCARRVFPNHNFADLLLDRKRDFFGNDLIAYALFYPRYR